MSEFTLHIQSHNADIFKGNFKPLGTEACPCNGNKIAFWASFLNITPKLTRDFDHSFPSYQSISILLCLRGLQRR